MHTYEQFQNFSIKFTRKRRDIEIELTNKRITKYVTPEQGLTLSPLLPKSVELINSVKVSPYCYSVHTYKGVTYARCYGGVDRIDGNNKVTKLFISIKGSSVWSVTVHNDSIYTLSSDSTVRGHDLEGTSITSWTHTENFQRQSQLALINGQVAIPDRLNRTLVVYSLNGEVVNTLACPLLTDTPVHLSTAENNLIIISQRYSSLVYKVDTSSGDIIWQCKDVPKPGGVTCYRDEFVVVADNTKPTTLCVLSLHTG